MRMLAITTGLILLLYGCRKEKLTQGPLEGVWKWQCTITARSLEDTVFSMADKPTHLYFRTYDFVEESGVYSLDLFLNDQIIQHLIIEEKEGNSTKFWGNTWLTTSEITDRYGVGYLREYFTIDGLVFPASESPFMQVVDFPYPGWNRFMFQE